MQASAVPVLKRHDSGTLLVVLSCFLASLAGAFYPYSYIKMYGAHPTSCYTVWGALV